MLDRQKVPPKLLKTKNLWKDRCRDIRHFENYLFRNGTLVRKFFLHVSRKEQEKRFRERLEQPEKNWKFAADDLKKREYWRQYQDAYEDMIRWTATPDAPWYVVPADNKWFTRVVVAAAIVDGLAGLKLKYPKVSAAQARESRRPRSSWASRAPDDGALAWMLLGLPRFHTTSYHSWRQDSSSALEGLMKTTHQGLVACLSLCVAVTGVTASASAQPDEPGASAPPSTAATVTQAPPAARPTVGLALGGGAARGIAHVGLLRWFEEHRIPVDYIAGTSMGGLIGGAYASGLSPDEIQALMKEADWDLMFLADSPFRYKTFRRKEDARAFPGQIDFGLKGGFKLPAGLNAGQQIEMLLDRMAMPYYGDQGLRRAAHTVPLRCDRHPQVRAAGAPIRLVLTRPPRDDGDSRRVHAGRRSTGGCWWTEAPSTTCRPTW